MSINSVDVTLWLEQPCYDALQRILQESGTDLKKVMQARLEELYQQTVPALERAKINLHMEAVRLAEERARLENMKISAFRIMEKGQDSYFITEQPVEFLETARLLRRYLRGELDSGSKPFAGYFAVFKWLAKDQFQDYVQERMRDPSRIVGVYNVDFDKQEVSVVDAEQGWRSYRTRDVSAAAYAAFRSQWIGRDERMARFLNHLNGKELFPLREQKPDHPLAVFRVTEGGSPACFMVEEKTRVLQVANRLRNYVCKLRKEDSPMRFVDLFSGRKEINGNRYNAFVKKQMDAAGQTVGVYDIDLDKGIFGMVNTIHGWDSRPIRNVTAAACHAMGRHYFSWDERWEEFVNCLGSKQIMQDEERFFFLSGSREIHAEDVRFEGDIVQSGNLLEFYMEVIFDPNKVFGAEVHTDDADSYINVYANYDMEIQGVHDTLEVNLVGGDDDGDEYYEYRLSEGERALLLPAMEAYCQQIYGHGLEDWCAEYQEEQQQPSQEMQM